MTGQLCPLFMTVSLNLWSHCKQLIVKKSVLLGLIKLRLQQMNRKLIRTADGSHTFFVEELNEHYHSTHGALQESQHVFIEAGLMHLGKQATIRILEIGFGTGLNALLTAMANDLIGAEIRYDGLEAYPLTLTEAEQLNYTTLLNAPEMRAVLLGMHQINWSAPTLVYKDFTLTKWSNKIEDVNIGKPTYDLVYFDAFAPQIQPFLWTEKIFKVIYDGMKPGGILVTYCAKGSVKRAMKAAGFTLEALPGPPGKREMTRGRKLKINA